MAGTGDHGSSCAGEVSHGENAVRTKDGERADEGEREGARADDVVAAA